MDNGGTRTVVPGILASGEAGCAMVHGTNRLGANSPLNLVVFGRQAADTTAELARPNSPLVVLPANAGEASIARLDKMWNQKGSLNTAVLRRELQNAMQKHAPVYQNGKDLHEGKGLLQKTMRKFKDVNCVDKKNLVWKHNESERRRRSR